MESWGLLTCIDASYCCNIAINDKDIFQEFIDELLDTIEMIKIGDLNIVWCETNDPKKAGYSIYQLLQDSNVSIHFCPCDYNSAYVDIFSCKAYDPMIVLDLFKKYFSPQKTNMQIIERQAPR
jgi:S-adenosylmethionine/arginine decarboxylase-like enzyme